MADAVNVRGEIYDVLRELAGRMVDGSTLPQAVMCWLGLPKPIADRLERGQVQQQSATPNLEALTPLGVSRIANAPSAPAAPREPAQDEPAAGVELPPGAISISQMDADLRAAGLGPELDKARIALGFARGVEAAAKLAESDGCGKPGCRDCVGGNLAHKIRALTPPAAPDPLLPGLRYVLGTILAQFDADDGGVHQHIAGLVADEIARRGGA